MSAAPLPVGNSHAALAPDNLVQRTPRRPERRRQHAFTSAFDARTLFYDCFWHADGERILLVGPPPVNLLPAFQLAKFVASPADETLRPRFFASLSVMVTELRGAPKGTSRVTVDIAGERHELAVQPSAVATLAGRKLLFSINKDNDLAWIREWASFHARMHGTDAVILFDNASTRYSTDEVAAALSEVPGIAFAGVPSWPQSFGPFDSTVRRDPFWARFLQIGSLSVVLRRYGEAAYGLLDCDIDELAGTRSGISIYELAKHSRGGLVAFTGTWIEPTRTGARHRDFTQRLIDSKAALSPRRKWALDPSREWVRKLSVHPYWHWIEGRALFAKSMPADALYWHFKPINTNWKEDRSMAPGAATETDQLLAASFAKLDP
jgi:hypothetical protein